MTRPPHKHTLEAHSPEAAPDVILFYGQNDAYGEFSNFAPAPIWLKGLTWPTTEH